MRGRSPHPPRQSHGWGCTLTCDNPSKISPDHPPPRIVPAIPHVVPLFGRAFRSLCSCHSIMPPPSPSPAPSIDMPSPIIGMSSPIIPPPPPSPAFPVGQTLRQAVQAGPRQAGRPHFLLVLSKPSLPFQQTLRQAVQAGPRQAGRPHVLLVASVAVADPPPGIHLSYREPEPILDSQRATRRG